MARVLFAFPVPSSHTPQMPLMNFMQGSLGISFISAYLRANGHETEAVVTGHNHPATSRRLLGEAVARFKPDLVGFSMTAPVFRDGVDVAKWLRQRYPDLYLIAGGPHVSLNPQATLEAGFDAACVGEGEQATLELVRQIGPGRRPRGIQNFWFRDGSAIEKNPPRPFVENLDSLPPADYRIWSKWVDPGMLALQGKGGVPTVSVLLGRGCPFSCTYCSNHALRKLASGTYVRVRSPESIVAEVQSVSELHPDVRTIYLEVETIAAKEDWAIALCGQLQALNAQRSVPLAFGCNLRVFPNLKPDAIFSAMKAANFTFLNIGLESGSERVRNEVLNRRYSNDDICSAVAAARRNGLRVYFYNLIGLPGETYGDFLETVRMNRLCAPDVHLTSIFEPYPGTELHRLCQEKGYLRTAPSNVKARSQAQLDFPGFSRAKIQHCYDWFDYYVMKGRIPARRLWLLLVSHWFHSSWLFKALSRFGPLVRSLHGIKSRLTKA